VEFLRDLFLVRSCLYHILTTSRGLSGIAVFIFMRMICRSITLVLRQTFKGVLMSLDLDLQRVHKWVAANGL
jgi:hypothetical protein